jgi:hypothetical protein
MDKRQECGIHTKTERKSLFKRVSSNERFLTLIKTLHSTTNALNRAVFYVQPTESASSTRSQFNNC